MQQMAGNLTERIVVAGMPRRIEVASKYWVIDGPIEPGLISHVSYDQDRILQTTVKVAVVIERHPASMIFFQISVDVMDVDGSVRNWKTRISNVFCRISNNLEVIAVRWRTNAAIGCAVVVGSNRPLCLYYLRERYQQLLGRVDVIVIDP